MTKATGSFTTKTWDEKPYAEFEGLPKITHTYTTNTYEGEIAGESTAHYVSVYLSEEDVAYTGYEQIVGRIGDREGSFVLACTGRWQDNAAATEWEVVEGASTGDLTGLSGSGKYVAVHGAASTPVTLDYTLPG